MDLPPEKLGITPEQTWVGWHSELFTTVCDGAKAVKKEYIRVRRILPNGEAIWLPVDFYNDPDQFCYLMHPNVVQIYKRDEDHCVLEYMERGMLRDLLFESEDVLDWETLRHMIADIAKGMAYLHGKNVMVFLSDDKVMVGKDYTCKISGVDCIRTEPQCTTGYDSMHAQNARFYSPEKLRADELDDEKSDVYSLGCIIYTMLMREHPFEGVEPTMKLLTLIASKTTPEQHKPLPEDVPDDIIDLMRACWQDEADRPSFQNIADAFDAEVDPLDSVD